MKALAQTLDALSPDEISLIHRSALRVLEEMGMEIENEQLLQRLADVGVLVDLQAQRARFPAALVERFIAEAEKDSTGDVQPRVSATAGVYHGLYHDPASSQLTPWSEAAMASYFALARRLSHVGGASMLGCRVSVPMQLEPLYERFYCWKYGAIERGSIILDELCPYVLELYEIAAQARGVDIADIFRASVYLAPAFRLGRSEAKQLVYFWERGLHVRVGDMYTMGATSPASLAGSVALNLAEQLALSILEWALWGVKRLHIGASLAVMDMRSGVRPFGRPEMALTNVMTAQLARYYGASFSGHAGLSDAKLPSVESGAQKMLTAIPTLLAGGHLHMDAGLLSIDEVCSPVQLVLDNEILSALKQYTREYEVSEESIGLDTILQAGPGGHYLDSQHTLRYYRSDHWQPNIWTRHMLALWQYEGSRLDVDVARDLVLEAETEESSPDEIFGAMEGELLAVIERARRVLVA